MASPSPEMIEWGIPDWQNPEDYGATEKWDASRWRWEFIRRREDYRRDFELALEGFCGVGLLTPWPAYSDPPEPLPRDLDPLVKPQLLKMRCWPFTEKGAAKYGLLAWFDPRVSDWPFTRPKWGSGVQLNYAATHGRRTVLGEKNEPTEIDALEMHAVTFDLSRPLDPQLNEAKNRLEHHQRVYLAATGNMLTERRARSDKWLLYLRVLDARASEIPFSEIARILPLSMSRRDAVAAHKVFKQAKEHSLRF